MTYTFNDLMFGETLDQAQPFYLAIGPSIVKTTLDEYFVIAGRIANQSRRYRRQSLLMEALRNDKN
jgi:hypothetical protein